MPRVKRLLFTVVASLSLAGCSTASRPVDVSDGDTCAHCRMKVSNPRLAAQIAEPGEEALFYDDIGCLAKTLAAVSSREFVYVADHRTGEWVRAADAVYTRVPSLETPMGSHIIAHADEASRRSDPSAAGGTVMSIAEVLGAPRGDHDGT